MNDALARFREAGKNGLEWGDAVDQVDPSLHDETDPDAYDAASDAYDAGQEDRVRAAITEAVASLCEPFVRLGADGEWVEESDGLTVHDADYLIEVAAQAAPIDPERIVAIVSDYCPVPRNAPRLAEMAFNDFQAIPRLRVDGASEVSPKPDQVPEVHQPLTVEEMRAQCGMPPLPMLRCVDYAAGSTYSPPSWLVKNFMPARGLGMLFGPSSAGKTFLAIHTSLCVAWGVPFFGRRAKPGGVLYIAAEGGSSVLPRFDAAEKALGIGAANLAGQRDPATGRAPIRIATEAPNLSRDGDPAPLVRTIRRWHADCLAEGHRPALVVVDTLHAALGGADENSAADMGHALKPLKDAVEELGLYTLILHHPGKDAERGARGSGSLLAAVDTSIELTVIGCTGQGAKPAHMTRCATINKQRDGAVGDALHYRLPVVKLGVDEDGDDWSTCTVQPCDGPKVDDEGLGANDRRLLEAVQAAAADAGSERAKVEVTRSFFYNRMEGKPQATKRKAWNRALEAGREAGRIMTDDHDLQIWIPSPAGEA